MVLPSSAAHTEYHTTVTLSVFLQDSSRFTSEEISHLSITHPADTGLHFLKSQLGTGAQLLELCPGTHPTPNFLVRSGTELLGGLLPARSHALPLCFPSHSLHLLQDLTQTHSWLWPYPINTRTAGSAFCSVSSHMAHSPEFQNLKGLTCCLI